MTRTNARELAIQLGFAAAASGETPQEVLDRFFDEEHYASLAAEDELYRERPDDAQLAYIRRLTALIGENRDTIDGYISRYARGWKIERISRTALAVLRCALCEILYFDDIPPSVSVNEAVEIAKRFDSPETVSFVNGLLGAYLSSGDDRNVDPKES